MWKLRKLVGLCLATALIFGGLIFMVAWEHPLSDVVANPALIFWDSSQSAYHINRLWFIGPLLVFVGVFWIAEDWLNFR